MYAAGAEGIWCKSEDEGLKPPLSQLHQSTHTLSPSPGLRWLCPCTLSELGFHPLCQLSGGPVSPLFVITDLCHHAGTLPLIALQDVTAGTPEKRECV